MTGALGFADEGVNASSEPKGSCLTSLQPVWLHSFGWTVGPTVTAQPVVLDHTLLTCVHTTEAGVCQDFHSPVVRTPRVVTSCFRRALQVRLGTAVVRRWSRCLSSGRRVRPGS